MSNVELLPLYAELQGHPKIEIIKHYARANVEASTEELRAEVAELKRANGQLGEHGTSLYAKAERLAEELRVLAGRWREPRTDDDCTLYTMGRRDGRRGCALDLMDALHPTAAQENPHA